MGLWFHQAPKGLTCVGLRAAPELLRMGGGQQPHNYDSKKADSARPETLFASCRFSACALEQHAMPG